MQIAKFQLQIASCWLGPAGFRLLVVVMTLAASLPGCVHRRLTVNSNPPGARVLLDGEEVGELKIFKEDVG